MASSDSLPDSGLETLAPSSVPDHQSKGGWKTLPFIIGNEACERMGSLSVLWNLIPYLTSRYHMTSVRAIYIVNAVTGTCSLTPLLGSFLADSYFGRYNTIIGSSFFSLMGLIFLFVSATSKRLQPEECTPPSPELIYECPQASQGQVLFLLGAFGLIAIGSAGLRSCVYSFGADQFDESTPQGRRARQRFFNWFYFFSCCSLLFGLTVIVYIQNSISWGAGYLVLTVAMMVSVVVFVVGSRFYIYKPVDGSPYSSLGRVVYAAFSKRRLALPSNPLELHIGARIKGQGSQLKHTDQLRWLDKAAIAVEGGDDIESKESYVAGARAWRLCTVHEVEECKSVLNLLPIWSCTILLSIVQTQLANFTISQAFLTNSLIGHFNVAPPYLLVVIISTFLLVIPVYDLSFVPILRYFTKNPRGLSLLRRIGVGIFFLALTMVVAGLVEHKRRRERISITWLIPQCAMLGLSDTFAIIGQFELYYEELPTGMRSMAGALFWSSNAVGSFLANLVVAVVQKQTAKAGDNWLPTLNINQGHLDYFYYLLACISMLTLFIFMAVAYRHTHVQRLEDDLISTEKSIAE